MCWAGTPGSDRGDTALTSENAEPWDCAKMCRPERDCLGGVLDMAGWLPLSLVAMAAATTLAGCADESENLLGDLTTIDPCSLTSPEVFARFGSAEFGEPEGFGSCRILVTVAGDEPGDEPEEISVFVGELIRPSELTWELEPAREEVADSVHLTELRDLGGSCAQELVFADEDLALTVQTRQDTTVRAMPTCDLAEAGMARVVEVILDGKVKHRTPPPNSLTGVDACDLLDEDLVTGLPGYADARRLTPPGRHECRWRAEVSLALRFLVGPPPRPGTDGVGERGSTVIAGRPTTTQVVGATATSGGFCQVWTQHISYGASEVVEIVRVDVELPVGTLDEVAEGEWLSVGCEGALAIAEHAWAKLPAI